MLDFEKAYLQCREKEGRIYSDEMVKVLPKIDRHHRHYFEWKIRAHSAKKIKKRVQSNGAGSVLEIGCGNGWLSNYLDDVDVTVTGIDVNQHELSQARRIFPSIEFIYGDVMKRDPLAGSTFDIVVIASVVQYFPNPGALIDFALTKLNDGGEVHIIDSPIYVDRHAANLAGQRSSDYFGRLDSGMADFYFHHCQDDFAGFEIEWLWRPNEVQKKLSSILKIPISPFPWICIRNK